MDKALNPEKWGLKVGPTGELMIGDINTTDLAEEYGTPLHIINHERLIETAKRFISTVENSYPAKTSVNYAFKCNSVPYVVQILKDAGLKAEVCNEYELQLAQRVGHKSEDIIVNGPCKPDQFLRQCLIDKVGLLVIDSIDELISLARLTDQLKHQINILFRVNPDYTPKGMNSSTATGSRKGCAFGLDLKGGEVNIALKYLKNLPRINFLGFHFHIGTGIRNPNDYVRALKRLFPLFSYTQNMGYEIKIMDVGGGIASFTTRELTATEMLLYQSLKHFPNRIKHNENITLQNFAQQIADVLTSFFTKDKLPVLIYEPGRSIASPNQFLLLRVHRVKKRKGVNNWLITDGGLGTVTLPTYYEYHEVFLCNEVFRCENGLATITGPCCFASDIVYRNKLLPNVKPGEVLAIMDTGAYFTALESTFGFPRPAIVAVTNGNHHVVRKRETFDDMVSRDNFNLTNEVSK